MVKSRLKPKKNDFKSKNPESTRPNTLNLSGKRGTYIIGSHHGNSIGIHKYTPHQLQVHKQLSMGLEQG